MNKSPTSLPQSAINKPQASLWILYLFAFVLLCLDQWSKYWVVNHLVFGKPVPVFEPLVYYRYVINEGAAFSILTGQKWVLSAIAAGVCLWIMYYANSLKQRRTIHLLALAAIFAGALGNLLDRLRLGHVVDFIDLHYNGGNIWPIFNVADMCINLGVALLILYFLLYPEEEKAAAEIEPTSHTT